jgi:hypothetical protein
MANPNSITNGQGREIDPLPNTAGAVKLKLAIGTKAVSGATDDAAWQGVATHAAGAAVAASDGVALVATGAVGGTAVPVSATNPMPVAAASLPLPTGAATSALQGANAAQDGTDATGYAPDTGGVGIRGWLSTLTHNAMTAALGLFVKPATGAVFAVSANAPGGGVLQTVTTMTSADTGYPLPATPLVGRVSILIRATSTNTADIYIGGSTVTATGAATDGIRLSPGQDFPVDISAAALIYGCSHTAGQKVTTLEIAA